MPPAHIYYSLTGAAVPPTAEVGVPCACAFGTCADGSEGVVSPHKQEGESRGASEQIIRGHLPSSGRADRHAGVWEG